jgi:hypothetical protein
LVALSVVWSAQVITTLTTAQTVRPFGAALGSIDDEPRRAIAAAAPNIPIVVLAHGDTPGLDGEAAVFAALLRERPHRLIDGQALLVLPAEPVTLLASLAPFQAWEELVAAGLATDARTIPRRERAEPFMLADYDPARPLTGYTWLDEPVVWENGAVLHGYRVRRVGDRLRISTVWRAGEPAALRDVQQFHHLRPADAPDAPPLVSDISLSWETWRAGDTVITMADYFDVSGGEYTVTVGHYTLADVVRIPRADGADSAQLGPFPVEP